MAKRATRKLKRAAKSQAAPRRKSKGKPGPLSRGCLNEMLIDLTGRLDQQFWLADAIVAVNVPNGQHTNSEHRLRTVFGLQVTALLSGIRDVHGFAKIICDAATRGSVVAP